MEQVKNQTGALPAAAEKSRAKLYDYHWAYLGIVMITASFLGFAGENLFRVIGIGFLDSRYMILPFIGPYGLAAFAVYFLLGTPDKMRIFHKRVFQKDTKKNKVLGWSVYCLTVGVFIMLGEIAVGMLYEQIAGVVLWDYRNIPLHITKYASIPTALGVTAVVFLIMKFAFVPFIELLERKMNYKVALYISVVLGTLIALDCLAMILRLLITHEAAIYWSIAFR